jgi:ribosomal protein S6E (S10)
LFYGKTGFIGMRQGKRRRIAVRAGSARCTPNR